MGILEHVKDIGELIKKYNDQDLYEKTITLREEILQLREENHAIRDEVNTLREHDELKGRLVRSGNCLFFKDDEKQENPYCLQCWGYEGKLVGLLHGWRPSDGEKTISCHICDSRGGRS